MKARKVKGLDCEATLADNAERIIRVRLDELYSFAPKALDPKRTDELHDMRIAAKRLRYVLEVTAFCFGGYATTAIKRVKELQDLLGEIHDCDEMLPRVRAERAQLRTADLDALVGGAAPPDLEGAPAYAGLEVLALHLRARRRLLFAQFRQDWEQLHRQAFRERLERSLDERIPSAAADDER